MKKDNNDKKQLPVLKPKAYLPILSVLLIGLILLGLYSFNQRRIIKNIESQNELALAHFMQNSNSDAASYNGTDIHLNNTRFFWSKEVFIDATNINAKAVPVKEGQATDFDNLNSFVVNLGSTNIQILPSVLAGMFNQSVFNYPESKLRDLDVTIVPYDKAGSGKHAIKLSGSIDYLLWIPFDMIVDLTIDNKTNTLVLTVEEIDVFGFIPVTPAIELKPFNLDKILTVPKNNHLTLNRNKIFIKPFGLFPPPKINGNFEKIDVNSSNIVITFGNQSGVNEQLASGETKNGITLSGGYTKFTHLTMNPTNIHILDNNQSDKFSFYVLGYKNQLPKSDITMTGNNSIQVDMPDYPMSIKK